jgi:hypothetical protein
VKVRKTWFYIVLRYSNILWNPPGTLRQKDNAEEKPEANIRLFLALEPMILAGPMRRIHPRASDVIFHISE